MSMNVMFKAVREILVLKTGECEEQTLSFEPWQTPTADTFAIIKATDPVQAYKDWIMSSDDCVCTRPVFAEDDPFEDGEPIGLETVDPRQVHLEHFDMWVQSMTARGFVVSASVV